MDWAERESVVVELEVNKKNVANSQWQGKETQFHVTRKPKKPAEWKEKLMHRNGKRMWVRILNGIFMENDYSFHHIYSYSPLLADIPLFSRFFRSILFNSLENAVYTNFHSQIICLPSSHSTYCEIAILEWNPIYLTIMVF